MIPNRQNIITLLLFIATIGLSSCNEWLTVRPENEVEKERLFSSEEGFYQALNGIYGRLYLQYNLTSSFIIDDVEAMVSLWEYNRNTTGDLLSRHNYRAKQVDNRMGHIGRALYGYILSANDILKSIEKDNLKISSASKDLIRGEALGLRAFFHFDIIRIWGPVPSTGSKTKHYLPYATETTHKRHKSISYNEYMKCLIEDLDQAEKLLKETDPITKHFSGSFNKAYPEEAGVERYEHLWRTHHMNYYAVLALKARVALWMQQKELAYKYAKMVIGAKSQDTQAIQFELAKGQDVKPNIKNTDKNDNVLSREHIFAKPLDDPLNWEAYWSANLGVNTLKQQAVLIKRIFTEPSDFRTELVDIEKGRKYATSRKYRSTHGAAFPLIRLSEMYLIAIESAPTLDEANEYYKKYCATERTTYQPMTQDSRKNIILNEYIKEFFAEGNIFFTHKRMFIKKPLWSTQNFTEAEYCPPIPTAEYDFISGK